MADVILNIVVLKKVKYSDTHSIVTVWSRESGRLSLLVADGSGRSAARMRALMMPPAILECVARIRPGRDIYPVSQVKIVEPLADIRSNPLKGMVGMFLAEAMSALLHESQPDEAMFDYISRALTLFDALTDERATANFHLCFLYHLGRLAGVEPDLTTWRPGRVLDMLDGVFRPTLPPHTHVLGAEESAIAARMGRMSFENIKKWRLTRLERNRALDVILQYLALHLSPQLAKLQSLDVLRALL